jgi:hypothetical protein
MKTCIACDEEIKDAAVLCKHCGTRQDDESFATVEKKPAAPKEVKRKPKLVVVAASLAALVALAVGISAVVAEQNRQQAAQAQVAKEKAAAQAEADRETREALEASAKKAAETQERKRQEKLLRERRTSVGEIEESVSDLAKDHIRQGLLKGKVLGVSCTPMSGYSLEDFEEMTTKFTCFVATEAVSGTRQKGYYYEAIMNWQSGSYTYGLSRD